MTTIDVVSMVMDNATEVIETIWTFVLGMAFVLGAKKGRKGKGILQGYFGFVLSNDKLSIIFLGDNKPFEM
jgi:hypothetical protein